MRKTVIPFGPQHPVLPEPIHLKLTVEDERIIDAIPNLGYVHRGLERLADIRDFHQMIQVVERVCGICSMIHAACYCQGIEELMGVEAPPRAQYLRVMWSELHRVQSHLLWLGLFADSFGFESLFMQFWRVRERIMDISEATTGNRVIVSVNVIGGVRRNPDAEQVRWVLAQLEWVEAELQRLEATMLEDYTVKKRTVGKGVLTRQQAYELGAVGPTARGSGVAQDARQTGYHAYGELHFEPVVETDGDCWARNKVRFRETLASIDLTRFGHFNGSIKRDGVELCSVISTQISYSNNLDRIETICAGGKIDGADPSMAAMTGSMETRFADTTLLTLAINGTACELEFAYTLTTGESLTVTVHSVYLPVPRIEIAGRAVVRRDGQTLVLRLYQSAAPDVTQLKVAPPKFISSPTGCCIKRK